MEGHSAFVRATTVGDLMTAQVLGARLEAEGIEVRLHGEALGPYRVTVGHLAATEVWVPEADLEDAVAVITAAEIDGLLEQPVGDPPEDGRTLASVLPIALLLLAFLVWRIVAWAA